MTCRLLLPPDALRARRRARSVRFALAGIVLAFGLAFAVVLSAAPVEIYVRERLR